MKNLIIIVVLLTHIACENKNLTSGSNFQGMWTLKGFEYFDESKNEWLADTLRTDYSGFIIYDGKGHMSVQITPGNYKILNAQIDLESLSCDSLKNWTELYTKNYSYFAEYTLKENVIQHHVVSASDPGLCGKDLNRAFEFKKDTLYLMPVVNDAVKKNRLKWVRSIQK